MATITVTGGFDTFSVQPYPFQGRSDRAHIEVRGGSGQGRHGALWMPVNGVDGHVVLSATLSGVCHRDEATSHTVTVSRFASAWNQETFCWNNEPGVSGGSASTATGPLSAGERVEWDVTSLVQSIASGNPNYGWRLTTDQSEYIAFRGFDAGADSWTLTIVVSDRLIAPQDLVPQGVVSVAAPVVTCDPIDNLAALQVQVDPAQDGTSPAFDSGQVVSTDAELDLAGTAYAGLADGASTFWRIRLKDSDGSWSVWSDWVSIERHVKPSLVVDEPSGGVVLDPSPTVQAHVTSGTVEALQVLVTDAGNRAAVRYNSGRFAVAPAAASVGLQIPLRADGRRVFPRDGAYDLCVRVWDRHDRVASIGDRPFVQAWQTITMDVDGAQVPPSGLSAVSSPDGSPGVALTWSREADPDAYVILRDGDVVARIDEADLQTSVGTVVARNHVPNPSMESGIGGWFSTADLSLTNPSVGGVQPPDGAHLRGRFTAISGAASGVRAEMPDLSVTPGLSYTFSAWLRAATGRQAAVQVRWFDAGNTLITGINSELFTGTGFTDADWERVSFTATAPAGAALADFWVITTGTWQINNALDVDGAMVTEGATLLPYFDGDTPSDGTFAYSWAGTPGASESIKSDMADWTYTDTLAPPNTSSTYTVRAITNGKQSDDSNPAQGFNDVDGVWILSEFGDVVLRGDRVDGIQQVDKRTTIPLPYRRHDVDVITAVGGYEGTFSGVLTRYDGDQVEAARGILDQLRQHPESRVTLVWGTVAIRAQLRGLSVSPHPDLIPDPNSGARNDMHTVSFGFQQVGDF